MIEGQLRVEGRLHNGTIKFVPKYVVTKSTEHCVADHMGIAVGNIYNRSPSCVRVIFTVI